MLEIRGKARRLKAREPKLGLIMIDYLQLMASGTNVENRVQEVSQISRSLKVLAGDLEVPVLALSQLSRAVESRTDKRPLLSDLRESGIDRAGRRPRDVPLPRRVLQRAVRGSGPRRGDPRQAPQRPDRHREARVPQAVREVLRPRAAATTRGWRRHERTNAVWVAPSATQFSCLCERCLDGRARARRLVPRRRPGGLASAGPSPPDTDVAFVRCRAGHELVVRRVDRPAQPRATRTRSQLQIER